MFNILQLKSIYDRNVMLAVLKRLIIFLILNQINEHKLVSKKIRQTILDPFIILKGVQ